MSKAIHCYFEASMTYRNAAQCIWQAPQETHSAELRDSGTNLYLLLVVILLGFGRLWTNRGILEDCSPELPHELAAVGLSYP
jgi:hypothetical protein